MCLGGPQERTENKRKIIRVYSWLSFIMLLFKLFHENIHFKSNYIQSAEVYYAAVGVVVQVFVLRVKPARSFSVVRLV